MIHSKLKTITQLKKIIPALKKQGKVIIFTNGCFDLLHYGHVKYLEDAKKNGDILIVGINSDYSVRRIKGKNRPLVNQADRLRTVAALESVDYVVKFSNDTPINTIRIIKPDILIKGADWGKNNIVGSSLVSTYGGRVKRIILMPGRSTTNIINKIAKRFQKK